MAARLATAVVGAGPAGLLFVVAGRLLAERIGAEHGWDPASWAISLYDKRETYARTHRLRMAPAAYLEIQRAVQDARFDALVDFLIESDFTPEVNVLEQRLLALAVDLGVVKQLCTIGDGDGETSLLTLRARLERDGVVGESTVFTVVGADSVHSAVRDSVRGSVRPVRHTHERIARIRVTGADLPKRLAATDQLRLAKVLGSVVDYRLNRNGYAELDLFLAPREFAIVRDLGASPRAPVRLSAALLGKLRAPLFRAIVDHLEHGSGGQDRVIELSSTFELEHAVMPKLTFSRRDLRGTVFLVGDAGISLPFQRGMSCLAHCALDLARVHVDLVGATDDEARRLVIERYDREAELIVRREISVVRARAQLVRTLREIVRVSALLPFPIQSWWLRFPDRARATDRLSVWFWLNVSAGAAALAVALWGISSSHPLAWVALPIEVLGGVVYHSALAFEGGSHRLVRRVWEIQILLALLAGVGFAARDVLRTGRWTPTLAPVWWLLLGAAFTVGLYAFEAVVVRWFSRAGLKFEDEA